jgi:hypothetical protein
MKTIECWKVMINNKSVVLRYNDLHNIGRVYEIGVTTTPVIGKLFAFTSEEKAIKFACKYIGLFKKVQVSKGVATNPVKIKRVAAGYGSIETFWKEKLKKKAPSVYCSELPENTICVDSFTPVTIEEIAEETR